MEIGHTILFLFPDEMSLALMMESLLQMHTKSKCKLFSHEYIHLKDTIITANANNKKSVPGTTVESKTKSHASMTGGVH